MKAKAILAGVALLAMAALPGAAAAANAVTSAAVNFRAAPNGAIYGTIPHGAPVTVLGRSGNWCQTEWLGRIGWVHCRYVQLGVARAPVVIHEPYDPYFYDPYPRRYGAPFIGFSLGLDFDRGLRHRHRHHRFDGRHSRFKGDGVRIGRGGGGGPVVGGGGGGPVVGGGGYLFDR